MYGKLFRKAGAAVMAAAMAMNGISIGSTVIAAESPLKYEFEDGEFTGTGGVVEDASASGGKYYYLEGNSDSCTLKVEAPETGMYKIKICYNASFGEKIQNLYVNGVDQGQLSFTSKKWAELDCGSVKLNKGENEITIKSSWGWTNFDYLTIETADLAKIQATQTTCTDIKASAETRALMSYLAEVYGSHIISGQQEIYSGGPHGLETEFEYLNNLTGHYPAIRGFDYGNFCCPCYGSDDGSTKRIIDWVKNKNGIATSSFHINVPKDMTNYKLGDKVNWADTTYGVKDDSGKEATNFKTSNAYVKGTKEYDYYRLSLETLAKEFNKLEAEGVPVIWRPLHEAEGGGGENGSWFWWGKEGSEVYKKLWIYTYETLTNDFNCHNLIWEWNSYNYESSVNWYPGDEYVDIIGYDKYNCTVYLQENNWQPSLQHNDSAISSTFYGIMDKYDSAKMISMAENDCFSTVENLTTEKAGWLYFCTWYDGGSDNINFLSNPMFNTEKDTIEMYQSDYCITLDELPANLYKKEVAPVDPASTTTKPTTTVTTADPSVTTTTTAPVFEFKAKSYKVEIPADRDKLVLTIEGAPAASIGGAIGYGTSAADWTNLEWKGNADSKGNLEVTVDVSEIPAAIKNAEIQIWWSNVWDSAREEADDADCELTDYKFTSAPAEIDPDVIYGDANCDGKVTVADATAILQAIGNPDKYALSEQGALNADCYNPGSGVTGLDALAIQKLDAQAVTKLPEIAE